MAHVAHNAKRRRLEQASSTLSKPFKSPLRKPSQNTSGEGDFSSPNKLQTPEKPHQDVTGKDKKTDNDHDTEHINTTTTTNKSKKTPKQQQSQTVSTPSPSITPKRIQVQQRQRQPPDPTLANLQKAHRTLQSRLLTLRTELDTTSQALKIESSNKDAELNALISKWRGVSQDAADEVFEGARERIARMGGVRGWKKQQEEKEQQMRGGGFGWDDGDNSASAAGGAAGDVDSRDLELRKAEVMDELEETPGDDGKEKKGDEKDQEEGEGEDEEVCASFFLSLLYIFFFFFGDSSHLRVWVECVLMLHANFL